MSEGDRPPPYSPYDPRVEHDNLQQNLQQGSSRKAYGSTGQQQQQQEQQQQQQPPQYTYTDFGYPQGYQVVAGSVEEYREGVPPPGYVPQMAYPQQQPSTVIVQPSHTQVVYVGGCPACRVGVLEDDFTCLGICCAVLLFPLGIICCLAMRQRRCPNCGAVFG
ncbi:PREDICTED: brain protein I3-like [Priapulus caudatus]|uniref:Membrane protein BRI3 n=1 Tax=Priapulus caudatus TaxID=37621 RepID=A0ABM1EW73_PRICU|nr:PREDICTED: brain protein I3-like [Priapulus caudatus]XP_014676442.1 PREDICTED: brain protein I3-like [Priapulus caudatus]XP_014676443.1 PREDICTED: brain protein I3-like [Priapulus caudatus]XP_014676444.1 PREDICTED: brain protein I3-like [Priapulus caudatus]